MEILFIIHAHFRWIIVLVALFVLFRYLSGWLGQATYKRHDDILFKIYAGVIDLQVTLGLVYLLWSGFQGAGFPRFRLEHTVVMIIAAVLAHLSVRWKTSPDSVRFRNGFSIALVSLLLIFIGVLMLPNGLQRWMMGN
jgi:hypothetical protein